MEDPKDDKPSMRDVAADVFFTFAIIVFALAILITMSNLQPQ